MIRMLLATLLLLGSISISFTGDYLHCLAADKAQPSQSEFAGQYSGEWIAKYTGLSAGEEHEGTWKVSIATDGEIRGVEFDKSAGEKGEISGFIDEDGYVKVFVKYDSGRVAIKGVLEKKGTRLTGTLKQTCTGGNSVCANIDIILKRI